MPHVPVKKNRKKKLNTIWNLKVPHFYIYIMIFFCEMLVPVVFVPQVNPRKIELPPHHLICVTCVT